MFAAQSEHIVWLISGAAAVLHTFFVVLLPLATWLVAVLRGVGKKRAEPAQATIEKRMLREGF